MFSSPALLLGSTIATVWAALFHLLLGKRALDILLFWAAGIVGFAVGQLLSDALGLHWLFLGQVHVIQGTLFCWLAMCIARWFKL